MARGVVTLRYEDLILVPALQWFVEGDCRTHEALFNFAEALEAGLQLEMVVCRALSYGRYDGDVIPLGTHIVGGRDDGDVDV